MAESGGATVETRFGPFDRSGADVITMVDPVPGFESCRRYVVLTAPRLEPFACVQGLDAPRPSFLVVDPRVVHPSYHLELGERERQRLAAGPAEPLLWLSIVRVPPQGPATVNLRAPIVVNPARMTALQVVAPEGPYATDHPLE